MFWGGRLQGLLSGAEHCPEPDALPPAAPWPCCAAPCCALTPQRCALLCTGREGYHTLLNTDLKLELDNLARFLRGAADLKKALGFEGVLLLEPKPQV